MSAAGLARGTTISGFLKFALCFSVGTLHLGVPKVTKPFPVGIPPPVHYSVSLLGWVQLTLIPHHRQPCLEHHVKPLTTFSVVLGQEVLLFLSAVFTLPHFLIQVWGPQCPPSKERLPGSLLSQRKSTASWLQPP